MSGATLGVAETCARFGIEGRVREAALRAEARVAGLTYPAQRAVKSNVLAAFLEEGVSESDLAGATGYGYDDAARARYESLLARVLGAERALARLSIVSGTHAIVTAVAACVPHGKTLLSATGRPYDTLRNAICDAPFALAQSAGIGYREVALRDDGSPDEDAVAAALESGDVAAVFVQRSRGYAPRPSLDVDGCGRIVDLARASKSRPLVLVDNCYGGAGGSPRTVPCRRGSRDGLADQESGGRPCARRRLRGGAGRRRRTRGRATVRARTGRRARSDAGFRPRVRARLVRRAARGRADLARSRLHGGVVFRARIRVDPQPGAVRTDIVQAIRLGERAALIRFAEGLQKAMPVNARYRPEPGPVPGYVDSVIMSSGAFVGGATIELSCDAPLREPYEVYVQGGLVAEHAVLGSLFAARAVGAGN